MGASFRGNLEHTCNGRRQGTPSPRRTGKVWTEPGSLGHPEMHSSGNQGYNRTRQPSGGLAMVQRL